MKYNPFCCKQLFLSTFLFLLIFSINTNAQTIQPDEQIIREMIVYARSIEDASFSSRPRIFDSSNPPRKTTAQNPSVIENEKAASANYALERRAFDIVNEQRVMKGLPPLKWNEDMARVARLHSNNMARYKFFSHTGRDGSTPQSRAKSLGVRNWYVIGENIAFNKGFRKPVEMACQHWMASPGHRENILDRGWTDAGIGVAIAEDGSYYFTQVFMTRF
jgi:uncharacterized protein YkwD